MVKTKALKIIDNMNDLIEVKVTVENFLQGDFHWGTPQQGDTLKTYVEVHILIYSNTSRFF